MEAVRASSTVTAGGDWRSFASFLVGAMCWVRFEAVGQVYLSELALAALLPFLLFLRGSLLRNRTMLVFLTLVAMWLAGQVVADVVRETDFRDYARGWANIGLLLVDVFSLYLLLYGSRRRFVLFAFGLALGKILSLWLAPGDFADEYPWKFGIGTGVTLLAALAGTWRLISRIPILAVAPLLAVSTYSLAVGFRSMFACGLLACAYALAQRLLAVPPFGARTATTFPRVAALLAGSLLVGLGVLEVYQFAAKAGFLDERSLTTFERQSQGEFGIFPGGRTAIFAAVPAVLDSPIVGHGSKAKDPDYASRILDARRYGYQPSLMPSWHTGLIPTHSMLLGAWVEAGVLGIFFWLWFALLMVTVLANLCRSREPLSVLVFYLGVTQLWHIAFSPFGGDMRLTTAFTLCLFVVVRQVLRQGPAGGRAPTGHGPSLPRPLIRGSGA